MKFGDASEEYATKGDSIEFKTPSISGKASALEDGTWKIKETFDTEIAAINWLRGKAGMEPIEDNAPANNTPATNTPGNEQVDDTTEDDDQED